MRGWKPPDVATRGSLSQIFPDVVHQRASIGLAPQDEPVLIGAVGPHEHSPDRRRPVATPPDSRIARIILDGVENIIDVVVQPLASRIRRERRELPVSFATEE